MDTLSTPVSSIISETRIGRVFWYLGGIVGKVWNVVDSLGLSADLSTVLRPIRPAGVPRKI